MEFFTTLFVGYPIWVWLMFFGFVLALLAFDLGVLHKEQHEITVAESLKLSAFYICMGLLFGAWLWWYKGSTAGMEYLTGYLIEKSLSMDNVFVIALIFSSLGIPRLYQHRVLFWGIMGVIVLRAIMIGLGAALVAQYQGVLVLFGLFLIFTGIKMLFSDDEHGDIQDNKFYKWLRSKMRFTPSLHQEKFWVRGEEHQLSKGWWATPLFLSLIHI